MSDLIPFVLLCWVVTLFAGTALALGWRLGLSIWPHIQPWFGRTTLRRAGRRPQLRWVFILGKHVICRVPFVKEIR